MPPNPLVFDLEFTRYWLDVNGSQYWYLGERISLLGGSAEPHVLPYSLDLANQPPRHHRRPARQ